MTGVRTELAFRNASACPLAEASAGTDATLTEVSWAAGESGPVTEQFSASADIEGLEPIFDYGSQQVYEIERDRETTCICEHIKSELGPLRSAYARNGDLHVTLHTADLESLRGLIADLGEEFGDVSLEYLVQGRTDADESALVPVDLRRLTDRQQEVLETAHGMGYFEYPRAANASEVAAELEIEPSTFAEHLSAAQRKLFEELMQ
jgi:predicted DNA binding protein